MNYKYEQKGVWVFSLIFNLFEKKREKPQKHLFIHSFSNKTDFQLSFFLLLLFNKNLLKNRSNELFTYICNNVSDWESIWFHLYPCLIHIALKWFRFWSFMVITLFSILYFFLFYIDTLHQTTFSFFFAHHVCTHIYFLLIFNFSFLLLLKRFFSPLSLIFYSCSSNSFQGWQRLMFDWKKKEILLHSVLDWIFKYSFSIESIKQ